MDNYDLLAERARNDLIVEAYRIADTDSAYDDVVNGFRPVSLAGSRENRPRRPFAVAAALALVAAVVIGVSVARRGPSDTIKVVPATDAPTPSAPPDATGIATRPGTESTVPEPTVAATFAATTTVAAIPVTMPGIEPAAATPGAQASAVAPLDPSVPVVPGAAWETLDLGPLSPRWDPVVVATDGEIIVLGGYVRDRDANGSDYLRRVGDGAAYDPVARTWRLLPDPSGAFAKTTIARWVACGCDVNSRITLVGPEFAATYDVVNGATIPLDRPPPGGDHSLYIAGPDIFTAVTEIPGSVTLSRLTAGATTWEALPPVGLSYVRTVLHIEGRTVVVGSIEDNLAGTRALILDETATTGELTWIDLNLPDRRWNDFFASTDGYRLLVWAGYGFNAEAQDLGVGVLLDPAEGVWRDSARIEERWWECSADGVPVPGGIVIDDCGALVHYRSAENATVTHPELELWGLRGGLPMVVIGDHLYRWGEPSPYAEGPDAPEAMRFAALPLVPA